MVGGVKHGHVTTEASRARRPADWLGFTHVQMLVLFRSALKEDFAMPCFCIYDEAEGISRKGPHLVPGPHS